MDAPDAAHASARDALGQAVWGWLEGAYGALLADASARASAAVGGAGHSALIDRLMAYAPAIRRERDAFERGTLPAALEAVARSPLAPDSEETALVAAAQLFWLPREQMPWEQIEQWLRTDADRAAACTALRHHLGVEARGGDSLWPLAALALAGAGPEDAEALGAQAIRNPDLDPPQIATIADGLARLGAAGLSVSRRLFTHPSRPVQLVAALALGMGRWPESAAVLLDAFGRDPALEPVIADAVSWNLAPGALSSIHALYLRAHPGMRAEVAEAALYLADPLRRPPPRPERDWRVRYLPALPGDAAMWPCRELMPAIVAALEEPGVTAMRRRQDALERAVGPGDLDELLADVSSPPVDAFESEGETFIAATGAATRLDRSGTFFAEQLGLVRAFARYAPGAPLGAVAIDVWSRAFARVVDVGALDFQVEAERLLLDTITWGHQRGADTLEDCEVLLSEAIRRALAWAADDPATAARLHEQVDGDAARFAENMLS
jgi:hypothetical protein